MKKAIPVRMPDWPEEELPSTKQVEIYLLFWEHRPKPLAPDPGIGFLQKSFWLDPEDLDISTHQAECYRASRLDRALFIRRLIATYHKRTTSRTTSDVNPAVRQLKNATTIPTLVAAPSAILQPVSGSSGVQGADLMPSEVNEISRAHGLAMCWQPRKCVPRGKGSWRKILSRTDRFAGEGVDPIWFVVKLRKKKRYSHDN